MTERRRWYYCPEGDDGGGGCGRNGNDNDSNDGDANVVLIRNDLRLVAKAIANGHVRVFF